MITRGWVDIRSDVENLLRGWDFARLTALTNRIK
jgi:hypothetical protein